MSEKYFFLVQYTQTGELMMPKYDPVLSLTVFIAIGPLQSVTQKRMFLGQYVRAGDYIAILAALYESCALLGRMFKDNMASLTQLLQVKPGNETDFMAFLEKRATERLERYRLIYSGDPDSLLTLLIATDYAKVGLIYPEGNVGSVDDSKRLARAAQGKVNMKHVNVWKRVDMTLNEGIGFGLQYPELTWELVSKQHKPLDDEDMEEWRTFLSLGAGQSILSGKSRLLDKEKMNAFGPSILQLKVAWSRQYKEFMKAGVPEIDAKVQAFNIARDLYPWSSAGFADLSTKLLTDSAEQAENLVLDIVRGYILLYKPELSELLNLFDRRT